MDFNPGAADAYNNLGNIDFVKGNYWEAKANYEKALEVDASLAAAKKNLRNVLQILNE